MDAGAAFYARVKNDTTLKTLLGTKVSGYARVEGGWPEAFSDETTFPRVTFFVAADDPERPGHKNHRVQVDIWVWSDGANGGPAKVAAVDERLLGLLEEQTWTEGTVRWSSLALSASDSPAGPGKVMRRRRDYELFGRPKPS